MASRAEAFRQLANAAEEIYDDREDSEPGEDRVLVNPRTHAVKTAVQDVQRVLAGPLYGDGWVAWLALLRAYRAGDAAGYYEAAGKLMAWARAESDPRPTTDSAGFEHGDDFRSVVWCGRSYTFTPLQAASVRILWDHWERGVPEVGQDTILEAADSGSGRLVHVFANGRHPAWGSMIVHGPGNGTYRLDDRVK